MFDTRMYFSGSMNHPEVVDALMRANVHRLFTFAAPKEAPEYLEDAERRGLRCRMMCDSGAFTAWNIGKPVKVEELIQYDLWLANKHPGHEFVFVALDVIPGERGRMPTEGEIKAGIDESFQNYLLMKEALRGHTVIPVFHTGEDRYVRDRYLSHTDYIGCGMNQNLSEQQRLAWAREAVVPGYKFHGLAATGNAMLSQVDWYSVDSSGWLMVAAMGAVLWPVGNRLRPLQVSSTSPNLKRYGAHMFSSPEAERLIEFVRSRGYCEIELATLYQKRILWNIEMWTNPPWKKVPIVPAGLF